MLRQFKLALALLLAGLSLSLTAAPASAFHGWGHHGWGHHGWGRHGWRHHGHRHFGYYGGYGGFGSAWGYPSYGWGNFTSINIGINRPFYGGYYGGYLRPSLYGSSFYSSYYAPSYDSYYSPLYSSYAPITTSVYTPVVVPSYYSSGYYVPSCVTSSYYAPPVIDASCCGYPATYPSTIGPSLGNPSNGDPSGGSPSGIDSQLPNPSNGNPSAGTATLFSPLITSALRSPSSNRVMLAGRTVAAPRPTLNVTSRSKSDGSAHSLYSSHPTPLPPGLLAAADEIFASGQYAQAAAAYARLTVRYGNHDELSARRFVALVASGQCEQAAVVHELATANGRPLSISALPPGGLSELYGIHLPQRKAHVDTLADYALRNAQDSLPLVMVGTWLEMDGQPERAQLFLKQSGTRQDADSSLADSEVATTRLAATEVAR